MGLSMLSLLACAASRDRTLACLAQPVLAAWRGVGIAAMGADDASADRCLAAWSAEAVAATGAMLTGPPSQFAAALHQVFVAEAVLATRGHATLFHLD
jgi:hypothetical protein